MLKQQAGMARSTCAMEIKNTQCYHNHNSAITQHYLLEPGGIMPKLPNKL